jgi:hypothetical protein
MLLSKEMHVLGDKLCMSSIRAEHEITSKWMYDARARVSYIQRRVKALPPPTTLLLAAADYRNVDRSSEHWVKMNRPSMSPG